MAGKSEINLSKIVSKGLIDRTIEERQNDIKKEIYKEINSQILKIDFESQTSSRIVVLVELNYLERIVKNSGEFLNETSLSPLKVKYILGFSNKSWKLVDFVSGLWLQISISSIMIKITFKECLMNSRHALKTQ